MIGHWSLVIGYSLVLVLFLAWLTHWFRLDLWYDEAFTLTNFVLVPLKTTVTDYSFPNNHVLFSLLSNLWLRLLGIGSVGPVLDRPWLLRVIPLAATLGTLGYVAAFGRRFLGRFESLAALIVLTTTLPFLNFAVQARGFSLSMMLVAGLLFHAAAWLVRGRRLHLPLLALLATLALYAIPLNLYFVVSLALALASLTAARLVRRGSWQRPALAVAALALGTGLAAVCYLPMLEQVVSNRYVASEGWFHFPTLYRTLPEVLGHFISLRWLLPALFAVGVVRLLRGPRSSPPSSAGSIRHSSFETRHWLIALALLVLLPFVLSFLRGDRPFLRVFVNLVPVFSLLVAAGLGAASGRFPPLARRPLLGLLILALYCHLSLAGAVALVSRRLVNNITAGRQSQDLSCNYYQFHYRPRDLVRQFAGEWYDGRSPVILFDVDYAALPLYLGLAGIEHFDAGSFRPASEQLDRFYVFTKFPDRFAQMLDRGHPGLGHARLNARPRFHNAFLLERRPGATP